MIAAARLVEGVRAGDPLAIARAITAVENEAPQVGEIARLIRPHLGKATTLGITGPPGSGKSTLISAIITELTGQGRKVAVIAVDPTSPISGGALLGDRVRMAAHSRNPAVFIRSLAAKGHLGGLTRMTGMVVDVLDAAGIDVVIIETVGTGQSEIDIADMAQVKLVICPPGLGDDLQAIKAGILEIADIFVVNKADLPGAAETALQLENMLHASGDGRARTVMRTSATSAGGVADLVAAIADRVHGMPASAPSGVVRTRRMLARLAAARIERYVTEHDGADIDRICRAVQAGDWSLAEAVHDILRLFAGDHPHTPAEEPSHDP